MKFVVTSTELYNRLQSIGRVINSKSTLPILDCFLFNLEDQSLKVTASDNETTLETHVEIISQDGTGQFAIASKSIMEALRELPEQPISFTYNESNRSVVIEYMNGQFSLNGQSADEYPAAAVLGDSVVSLTMSATQLLDGINRTVFATADDELRPVMNGIYFDITPDGITFVASDGHKLVRNRLLSVKGNEKAAFIMQKKPATVLRGLLAKEADDVAISFDSRNVIFTTPVNTMVCRLIDGRYPNYNSVIPQNNPYKVTINRQSLISALKRVSVCSSASSSLIKLRLQNNQLDIYAQDIDFAASAEEHIVCEYAGEPMSIGFKSTFLIDILNNISGEDVIIAVSDPSRAGVLTPAAQEEESDLLMLLMPMMLND